MTFPLSSNRNELLGRWYSIETNKPVRDEYFVPDVKSGKQLINIMHRKERGEYRSGGPWLMSKTEVKRSPSESSEIWGQGEKWYEGGVYCKAHLDDPTNSFLPSGWGTDSYANDRYEAFKEQGAIAWNRLRPDLPDFSLATSLYELRDFPGMAQDLMKVLRQRLNRESLHRHGRQYSRLSWSGKWYLAIEFGWLPLYKDIRNFAEAHNKSAKRLAQLIRDAGRPVRRSTVNKDGVSHWSNDSGDSGVTRYSKTYLSSVDGTPHHPTFVTQCYKPGSDCQVRTERRTVSKTWAEGQFRYFLPPGPRNAAWKRSMYRRIMGGRLTPDMVYNIMPWSWLIDYFTDLGQFMKAISPGVADLLICDYAYLMREKTWTESTEARMRYGVRKVGNTVQSGLLSSTLETKRTLKMRVAASPFGFGIKNESLNPKQVAILGALGLSRLP